jgi:glycine/D-amino acid oxidase-like deaminating enzyme
MSRMPDVAVIGAGIVGAACAYSLARAGLSVLALERDFPAAGTSRACDGLILCCDKTSPAELELAQVSAGLWAGLAEGLDLDFEYGNTGVIVVYATVEGLEAGRKQAIDRCGCGVKVEMLDAAGLLALEPNLAPDLAGGIYYLDEAQVDARRATLALLQAARRCGAELRQGVSVTGLRRDAGGRVVAALTTEGEIEAGAFVLAAGVWSNEIAASAGLQLPVRPRKGTILVTSAAPGMIQHPLLEGSYAASVHADTSAAQVALVAEMTAGGTLLLGSSREFVGFDRSVSPAVAQAIAARAMRYLPALAERNVIRAYAGLRPWSPDHLPLIGPVAGVPGLYLATGHEGAGIGLAPVTGEIIARWLIDPAYGKSQATSGLARTVWPGRFGDLIQDAAAVRAAA